MGVFDSLRRWATGLWADMSPAMFVAGVCRDELGTEAPTPEAAEKIEAVYTCSKILSEGMGTLPFHVYKGRGTSAKRLDDHWLLDLFNDPGLNMTRQILIERAMHGCALVGKMPFMKIMDGSRPVQLIPLPDPHALEEVYVEGARGRVELAYRYKGNTILPEELWLPSNVWGLSPISVLARQLNLVNAFEKHAVATLNNSVRPSGVVTHPGKLSEPAKENMREGWRMRSQGVSNAGELIILHEGMTFSPITLSNEDLQFVEQNVFTRRIIFGVYRVPPHMAGDLERATFSNIEHQVISYSRFTLAPWVTRFEGSIKRDFLRDEPDVYVKFNMDGLQRGDYKTSKEGNGRAILTGQDTINEIRALDDKPPVPGGDRIIVPVNMQYLDELGKDDPEPDPAQLPPVGFAPSDDEDNTPTDEAQDDGPETVDEEETHDEA